MTTLRSNKVLADAGVILVEGLSTQVLRRPAATGSKLYVTFCRVDAVDRRLSELTLRQKLQRQLSKAGVQLTDLTHPFDIGGVYACFVGVTSAGKAVRAGGDSQAPLLQATQEMQEMQMSFNLQYLQLQSQMQNENRQFTMVSNIMKTKHDTVKNSISNVR